MMRRSASQPPVDHRPLHSVAALALALPRVPQLLLPEQLSEPAGPWVPVVTVAPVALILGWQLLMAPGLEEPLARWVVAIAIGLLSGAAIWAMARRSLRPGGWLIDFEQRRVVPVGPGAQEPIVLDANEHSLGCYLGGGSRSVPSCVLELRHVRRGPVAQLSVIPLAGSGKAFEHEREQLDRCVDMLAQRLHIRRSGEPLLTAAQRRAAS